MQSGTTAISGKNPVAAKPAASVVRTVGAVVSRNCHAICVACFFHFTFAIQQYDIHISTCYG